MRILVFSDLHGNSLVLNDLQSAIYFFKPDRILFLGDVFGYFYDFKEVIEFLKFNNVDCILGNHDENVIKILRGETNRLNILINKYGNGYSQIFKNIDLYNEYLFTKPTFINLMFNERKILFVHGSPDNHLNGRIYKDTKLNRSNFDEFDLVFCGHTHHRLVRIIGNKVVVNVGSAGQPRDGLNPCFVLYDLEHDSLMYYDLIFDRDILKKQMFVNLDFEKPYFQTLNRHYKQ
jgi:putative phosphoesterase